ncbi:MAG TPA: polysaccharide biosynthesis tyrosine autokinase [Chloroflexia bacterium]|nr:polysaccharide biosynthesis tyrosine autokinase [Chloroflexia bacterium]
MPLLRYWKVIQKSLWLIIIITLVGGSYAAYNTLNLPPEYESSSKLLLNPSIPNSMVPYVQTQMAANLADSYSELLRTRTFGELVANELAAQGRPFTMQPEAVGGAITTKLTPNTLFFQISARMDSADKAQQLLETVIKVFKSYIASQEQAKLNAGGSGEQASTVQLLDQQLKYLDEQIKSYQGQISVLEAQPATKDRDDQLLQLRGQMVTLQQAKTSTIVARGQISSVNSVQEVDKPLPGRRVPSRLVSNVLLAVVVSLILGLGLAFLRDYLDYTIHSPEQLQETVGVAPIAAIGIVGGQEGSTPYGMLRPQGRKRSQSAPQTGNEGEKKLVTLEHSRSLESESFRVLRTNIQFSGVEHPIKSLVVTSPGPGEGKSFTSANLAIVMAQAGKRVMLVDVDLRKPSLHKLFGLPNTVGFTSLVVGDPDTTPEGAIQMVPSVSNLAVITSGPLPPNPSELLSAHRAVDLMAQLSSQADIVIYDTPPAGVVTDPVILATRTDATILVIAAGKTRRDMIARVMESLKGVGVTSILPVLNRVWVRDLQGYYSSYYYYGNDESKPASRGRGDGQNGRGRGAAPGLNGNAPYRAPSHQDSGGTVAPKG